MSAREETWLASAREHFDVLIVGGGITGSGVARDAALRGLKCLLVDKNDFATGTSSRSGKLIHGGLRYLRYFHLRLVFEACRERRLLLKTVAPHLVRPTRFVLPFYRDSRTPRWLAAIGLFLYDLLSLFRNVGRFHFLSREALREEEPGLRATGAVGGLSYYDCACLDARLVIDTLKSARAAGAHLLNYCELVSVSADGLGIEAELRDTLTSRTQKVKARALVNAGGVWADEILGRARPEKKFGLKSSCGVHVVVPRARLGLRNTLALEVPRDGRNIYLVPWDETVLVGTTDNFYEGDKDRVPIALTAVDYLLETVNHYFPGAALGRQDLLSAFAGIRPLIGSDEGVKEEKISRDYEILVDRRGIVSVTGGKLTTYRSMAAKAVDELIRNFFSARALSPCRTDRPLLPDKPVFRPDVAYAVQEEFVEKLTDLLLRRWGAWLKPLSPSAVEVASRELAARKGWSEERRRSEIEEYEAQRGLP